jgi:hypothetical protein
VFENTVWCSHIPLHEGPLSANAHFSRIRAKYCVSCNLRIRIGLSAILIGQSGLYPGNQAIGARHPGHSFLEVLHAIVLAHRRGGEGAIADHDALGFMLGEELRFQCRHVGICV